MELWSSAFLNEGGDWATASVGIGVWNRVTADQPDARRLFVRMELPGERVTYCALGAPVTEEGDVAGTGAEKLYLPHWVLARLGAEGVGEQAEVDWFSEEAFPEATRVVLRPHDSAFYHADAKEELERALTRIGVVERGTTILIPLTELGGYEVAFDVVLTEPANIVLAQGDEVALEFEEALDAAAFQAEEAPAQPPEPEPAPQQTPDVDYREMIPVAPATVTPPPQPGRILGGGPIGPRLLPDGRRWNPWRDGPWAESKAASP